MLSFGCGGEGLGVSRTLKHQPEVNDDPTSNCYTVKKVRSVVSLNLLKAFVAQIMYINNPKDR